MEQEAVLVSDFNFSMLVFDAVDYLPFLDLIFFGAWSFEFSAFLRLATYLAILDYLMSPASGLPGRLFGSRTSHLSIFFGAALLKTLLFIEHGFFSGTCANFLTEVDAFA